VLQDSTPTRSIVPVGTDRQTTHSLPATAHWDEEFRFPARTHLDRRQTLLVLGTKTMTKIPMPEDRDVRFMT
jgi:hypothetical protein